MLAKLLNTEE